MLCSTAFFALSAAVALAHGDQDHDESSAIQSGGEEDEDVSTLPLIILGGLASDDDTEWADLYASVVDVSPTATVFEVNCGDGTWTACAMPGGTVTQGPSVLEMNNGAGDEKYGTFTQNISCDLDYEQDSIDCIIQLTTWSDGVTDTISAERQMPSKLSDMIFPVTITGGMDKISAAPAATATDSAATATIDQTTLATANSQVSESASTTGREEAASTTISGNAASPMITQNALLAGVAAVVGGVMIL